MAALDINEKAEVYETLSSLNMAFAGIIQHLQTLHKPDCLNPKPPNFSQVSPKSCKPNLTKSFLKICIKSSLTIGDATGKRGNDGKSISAIPMTFSFTLKNAKRSLLDSARNADSLSQFDPRQTR